MFKRLESLQEGYWTGSLVMKYLFHEKMGASCPMETLETALDRCSNEGTRFNTFGTRNQEIVVIFH
jgi:hypothetical protein